MNDPRNQPDGEEQLPQTLRGQLHGLYGAAPRVPGEVDHAILAAAGAKFDRHRRFRLLLRWGGGVAAAAALVLVAIRVATVRPHEQTPHVAMSPQEATAPTVAAAAGPSAKVSILDALRLERQLENDANPPSAWDFNRDGVVNRTDVQAIANRAVSLEGGQVQ